MIIREAKIDNINSHLATLFEEHREELTTNKDLMIVNPDMDKYYALEAAGALVVLGAYKDEIVIGYSINFVLQHLHYKDLCYSTNDLLFVSKPYRKSRLGLMLIKETEKACKLKGSKFHLWHAKPNTTLVEILPKLGYKTQDIIYSKEM